MFPLGEPDAAGLLPCPLRSVGPELCRKVDPVDPQCEPTGRRTSFPDRGPVAGAGEEMVFAGAIDVDFGLRVCDRYAGAVRHQTGGAHPVHRNGVHHPAATVAE